MRQLHEEDVKGIHDLYPASEIESIEVFEKLAGSLPGESISRQCLKKYFKMFSVAFQDTEYSQSMESLPLGWFKAITVRCSACKQNRNIDEKGEKMKCSKRFLVYH